MLDMDKMRSLVSFVGLRDPYPEGEDEAGPLLALLLDAARAGRPYDEAWLLCTGGAFLERARDLEREARDEGLTARFIPVDFTLKDVIDYAEIWERLKASLALVREKAGALPRGWTFLLDSGTPQMKISLFLAARSGLFPATLLQGIPPRFAGGTYKCREVRVAGIPEVRLTGEGGAPVPVLAAEEGRGYPGARPAAAPAATGAAARGGRAEGAPGEPVGGSQVLAELLRTADRAARYEDPVLLLGETGSGKTMAARRIHAASPRSAGPFVEVNCSAIAESLAESELFGHARNAFTGADKARAGKFRAAHGGTLFLDEVGDLSLEVQAKLLKALEDRAVTPVGSDEPLPADARLLAATNRDLPALIREGRFRRDLYERLKVVVLKLPPLRERREDIRPLATGFLAAWNDKYGEARRLTEDAYALLEAYSWPGNVRELENAMKSAACAAATEVVGPECLPDDIRQALRPGPSGVQAARPGSCVELPPEGLNLKARLLQVEWEYVSAALRQAEGNREAAARLLGLTGHAFRKALRERLAGFADVGWEEGM